MEHVELETLDREHTASNKKDPQLNHEKKPTKKSIKVLKLIGTKTLLFAFIILFIVGFSALFGSTATYTGVCIVTGLLMFLKLDIGIKHTQAPFVIFGLFVLSILKYYELKQQKLKKAKKKTKKSNQKRKTTKKNK